MVDAEILRGRLVALLDYSNRLEPFRAMNRQRCIANRDDHHVYLNIDHGITWDTIRNDLGDLRRLAEIAAATRARAITGCSSA